MLIAVATVVPGAAGAVDCDVEGRSDGCSTPGPTAFPETLTKSCKMHDRCYATDGMGKSQCDDQFQEAMKSSCESLSFLEEPLCKETAGTYYTGVLIGGGESYDNGQKWSGKNCGTTDWWSKIRQGHNKPIICPSGMIMAGRYKLSETKGGFSSYYCKVFDAPQARNSQWYTAKKNVKFICPGNMVLVGMEPKKHTRLAGLCATLSGVPPISGVSWSNKISGNGKTFYCPSNMVLVGFERRSQGVKFACRSF